jgi:hypothetical protein
MDPDAVVPIPAGGEGILAKWQAELLKDARLQSTVANYITNVTVTNTQWGSASSACNVHHVESTCTLEAKYIQPQLPCRCEGEQPACEGAWAYVKMQQFTSGVTKVICLVCTDTSPWSLYWYGWRTLPK